MDNFEQIFRTDAKSKYGLTDDELSTLPVEEKMMSCHGKRQNVMIYSEFDVVNLCCKKYGSVEEYQQNKLEKQQIRESQKDHNQDKKALLIEKREEKLRNELAKHNLQMTNDTSHIWDKLIQKGGNKEKIQKCVDEIRGYVTRKKDLADALRQYNLNIRADSRLCTDYINGDNDDLNEVVSIMRDMDFLYKHTNYPTVFNKMMEREARELKDMYGYWQQREEYVHYVSENAKIQACEQYEKANKNMDLMTPDLKSKLNDYKMREEKQRLKHQKQMEKKKNKKGDDASYIFNKYMFDK